jgi:hypothetical protein
MANNGYRLPLAAIGRDTAMCHDAGINGIDVYEFAHDLSEDFAWDRLNTIPWQRFSDQRASFYGCSAVLMFPLWLLARILTWPIHREAPIPGPRLPDERLTVGHIAAVLDRGEWFEPEGHA